MCGGLAGRIEGNSMGQSPARASSGMRRGVTWTSTLVRSKGMTAHAGGSLSYPYPITTILECLQLGVGNTKHLAKDEFHHKSIVVVFRYYLLTA